MTFEGACRLVGHVTERFNHAAHMGQGLGAHTIAAIDDTGNSSSAHARFTSNLAESWMRISFSHCRAAQGTCFAVEQVYAAQPQKLRSTCNNSAFSGMDSTAVMTQG